MTSQKVIGTTLALIAVATMIGLATFIPTPTAVPSQPPQTVPQVDLERYQGTWYEISSIPAVFSVGCTKTQATYTLNEDTTVKVANKCLRFGSQSETFGTAIAKDSTYAKLEVSFFPGTAGPYWIVRLADDYSYVVVSDDVYDFLWVLSRTPKMDETLYKSIIEDLRKDDFPVDSMKRTEQ